MQYLVADEASLNVLSDNIMSQIEWLNKIYHRQRPLVLDVSRHMQGRVWTIWVQGDSDKIAAMIYIKMYGEILTWPRPMAFTFAQMNPMHLPMKPWRNNDEQNP